MRPSRRLTSALCVAVALICAGCAAPRASSTVSTERGDLRSGAAFRLAPDERTRITVPEGWRGEYHRGNVALYDESSIIGTESVLPQLSSQANLESDDADSITLSVFSSRSDALKQQIILKRAWEQSGNTEYLPPWFDYSPRDGVRATGSVQFGDEADYRVEVLALVVNDRGASFLIDAHLPMSRFSKTTSPQQILMRVFDLLDLRY